MDFASPGDDPWCERLPLPRARPVKRAGGRRNTEPACLGCTSGLSRGSVQLVSSGGSQWEAEWSRGACVLVPCNQMTTPPALSDAIACLIHLIAGLDQPARILVRQSPPSVSSHRQQELAAVSRPRAASCRQQRWHDAHQRLVVSGREAWLAETCSETQRQHRPQPGSYQIDQIFPSPPPIWIVKANGGHTSRRQTPSVAFRHTITWPGRRSSTYADDRASPIASESLRR